MGEERTGNRVGGHTLISALVALFVISTVTVFLTQGLTLMVKANRATQQRAIASCLLDLEIESLRARRGRSPSLVTNKPLFPPELRSLPNAAMSLTVRNAALPDLKEVTLQLRWREPGGPQRQARVVTLAGER